MVKLGFARVCISFQILLCKKLVNFRLLFNFNFNYTKGHDHKIMPFPKGCPWRYISQATHCKQSSIYSSFLIRYFIHIYSAYQNCSLHLVSEPRLADHQTFGYQPVINLVAIIIEAFRYILGDSPFFRFLAICY